MPQRQCTNAFNIIINRVPSLNEIPPHARVTALIVPRQMCGTALMHLDLRHRILKEHNYSMERERRYELD